MEKKGSREKIGDALLKVALGCRVEEVTEEYADVDGALKLTKRRKTKKDIPPDLKAVQLLLGETEPSYSDLSDEELEAEKNRLLKLLKEEKEDENGRKKARASILKKEGAKSGENESASRGKKVCAENEEKKSAMNGDKERTECEAEGIVKGENREDSKNGEKENPKLGEKACRENVEEENAKLGEKNGEKAHAKSEEKESAKDEKTENRKRGKKCGSSADASGALKKTAAKKKPAVKKAGDGEAPKRKSPAKRRVVRKKTDESR